MTSSWYVALTQRNLKARKRVQERERDSSVFLCEGIRLDYAYVRVRPVCVVCKVQLKCTGTQ